jgi:hypothetical protein
VRQGVVADAPDGAVGLRPVTKPYVLKIGYTDMGQCAANVIPHRLGKANRADEAGGLRKIAERPLPAGGAYRPALRLRTRRRLNSFQRIVLPARPVLDGLDVNRHF